MSLLFYFLTHILITKVWYTDLNLCKPILRANQCNGPQGITSRVTRKQNSKNLSTKNLFRGDCFCKTTTMISM